MSSPINQKNDTFMQDRKNNDPFIDKIKNAISEVTETVGEKNIFTEEFYNDCRSIDDVKFKIYTYSLQSGCSVVEADKRVEHEAEGIWEVVKEYLENPLK